MQLAQPVHSGAQVDTSTAGQLYRLGQEMEKVVRDSTRKQLQRELTAEEEREMQVHIYGTTSVLSQEPVGAAEETQDKSTMEDAEWGDGQ